jgi:predicted SnoaL-like aldol condensation-catalyzing enzyme
MGPEAQTLLKPLLDADGKPARFRSPFCSGSDKMTRSKEARNKVLVLEAFDTLFNQRDYAAAERLWSPSYIQHRAHIQSGREGLIKLIKSLPPTLKYELDRIVADGDFVIVHGRFSGFGQPGSWIAADIVRIENGVLVERWDALQDEVNKAESKPELPMFGERLAG